MIDFIFMAVFSLIMGLIGAVIFRIRGTNHNEISGFLPRPFEQLLFSAPWIWLASQLFDPWQAIILSIITVVMVLKAHGKVFDLGTARKSSAPFGEDPEWYDGILYPLYGKIPEYWYDAIGLAVSGLSYTIPVGLFMADPTGDYFTEGLIIALSGALKAPAYMIGRCFSTSYPELADVSEFKAVDKVLNLRHATEWGEVLTGFFLWTCAGTIIYLISISSLF